MSTAPPITASASKWIDSMTANAHVDVLIALLKDLPLDQIWEAEEVLSRLAGDKGPSAVITADATTRTKAVEAWNKWWEDNEKTVVLRRADLINRERYLGYVVVCRPNDGTVLEMDKNRKTRWQITGLMNPWDMQMLPNNRVLITEYNGMRVTERDLKGKVLWEHRIQNYYPVSA